VNTPPDSTPSYGTMTWCECCCSPHGRTPAPTSGSPPRPRARRGGGDRRRHGAGGRSGRPATLEQHGVDLLDPLQTRRSRGSATGARQCARGARGSGRPRVATRTRRRPSAAARPLAHVRALAAAGLPVPTPCRRRPGVAGCGRCVPAWLPGGRQATPLTDGGRRDPLRRPDQLDAVLDSLWRLGDE